MKLRSLGCVALLLFAVVPSVKPGTARAAVAARAVSPGETSVGTGFDGQRNGFTLSPDGRWLVFSNNRGRGYKDLTTDKMFNAPEGWFVSAGQHPVASWSPNSQTLALLVQREGKQALTLWPAGAAFDAAQVRELLLFPRDLYPGLPAATWSPDGKTLFVRVTQMLPRPKKDPKDDNPPTQNHTVGVSLAGSYQERYGKKYQHRYEKAYPEAYAETFRELILAIDVATGRAGVLARGNDIDSFYVSPDSKRLAVVQVKIQNYRQANGDDKPVSTQFSRQHWADVYLIDVAGVASLPQVDLEKLEDRKAGWSDHSGRRLEPVLADLPFYYAGYSHGAPGIPSLSWAPDSTAFAYATVGKQAAGDVFVFDVATRRSRNLTAHVELAPSAKSLGYAEDRRFADNSPKFGSRFAPSWLPDGKALVVGGKGDVWIIPVDAQQAPRKLAESLHQEVIRIVPSVHPGTAATDAEGRLMLIAKDRESRYDSVWKLDAATGAFSAVADAGLWIHNNATILTDQRCAALLYSGQSVQSATNIYRLRLDGAPAAPQRLTDYRLHLAERRFPESRVLSWKTSGGKAGYGVLYLPEGASAAAKAPVVVYGYPDERNSRVDERAAVGASSLTDFLNDFLREGIAVLHADVPISDWGDYEQPMQQIVAGVDAATDAALATGVVDPARLGILGESYGGYMVNAVIAHTKRFKAAVSVAGLSDLFGHYLGTAGDASDYYELGQGRMSVPLWEDPQRYVENSPLIHWDRVRTPVLFVHGLGDNTVPMQFGRESFKGLLRLDRDSIFAVYSRMGHEANVEALQRIRGWFREHLLSAPPITHMAEQGSFFLGGGEGGEVRTGPTVPDQSPAPAPISNPN